MRGYFGIGAESISKPMNLGNLIHSADASGASFVFLIDADYTARSALSDTSQAERQMPLYRFDAVEEMVLPKGCVLIGVELTKRPSCRASGTRSTPPTCSARSAARCRRPWSRAAITSCASRPGAASTWPPPARSSCTIAC
jgi:hypothetical protein